MSAYFLTPVGAIIAALLALFTLSDVGQALGLIVVVVTFVAVGRTRAKDATIKTWRDNADAEHARADRLQDELTGAQERADREHDAARACERQVAHLEGEIKTLERYTAQEALTAVAAELKATRETIVGAISSQGELVMRNTEILSKIDGHLGRPSGESAGSHPALDPPSAA